MSLFSIIVVCLNPGEKLKETVDSILLQTEKDVEIIIFERVRGIVHSDNITLHAGTTTSIDTPWSKGIYTIILKLSNGDILRGDFIII